MVRRAWVALLLGVLCTLGTAQAQSSYDHVVDLLDQPESAGMGFIFRFEESPYVGGGTRQDFLPLYLYQGKRFFVGAERLGWHLVDEPTQRFDVFVARRLEGFPEDQTPDELEGLDYRNTGVDAGLMYRYIQPWGRLRSTLLHDIGGVSQGTEWRVGYSYDWHGDRWILRPDITVAWRDARLNDYYYGVRGREATLDRPAYSPGSGINWSVGLYGSYQFLDNWKMLGGVSLTMLDSTVTDSPIVRDGVLPAVYLGVVYDFGTAATRWDDTDPPLLARVFYGRASGEGCHMVKIMTLSCTSLDHDNPTSITGFQLGRPFLERVNGWPLDFNGYVGLLRHNENGLQQNGWQVDAYMKALYYGFPWNRWVQTRVGFGFGVSYANPVPWTEVTSQARRDRPTSRLLNYLDPTIDVNVGDIFRADHLRKTWFGLGISHRSGIFASSRLLGNVNGGSNYIYAYVESEFK